MSTVTFDRVPATAWKTLFRELYAAGWRHRIVPPPPGQFDGPDWVEHEWARGDKRINAYVDLGTGQLVSYLNYCPTPYAGDPDTMDIHTGVAAANGPVWLREVMVLCGILPAVVDNDEDVYRRAALRIMGIGGGDRLPSEQKIREGQYSGNLRTAVDVGIAEGRRLTEALPDSATDASPRVWAMPQIPAEVAAVRDAEGFVWRRVLDVDGGVWRRSTGAWTGDIVTMMVRQPQLAPLTEAKS